MKRCKNCVATLLGTCYDMRPCRVEREMLEEQTQHRAKEHGHTLAEFTKLSGQAVFRSQCLRCGRQAVFNLDPPQGELDIYGDAVDTDCPNPDEADQATDYREGDA